LKALVTKTDNYKINYKIYLREKAVEGLKELRVLDVFAGNNLLWNKFDKAKYYGIEIIKGKGKNLNANNLKVLPSLDLSQYNIIDLDSYGIPAHQIEALYNNLTLKKGTICIYTCISNGLSGVNKNLINHFGLSRICKKCKTLINKKNKELFYAFLFDKGVKQVFDYTVKSNSYDKTYGYFIV
jgi:hypothetical protein